MRTEITPGQDSDYTGYDMVMADNLPQPAVLVADRGYDSDKVREDIESRNVLPMIPMRKNRRVRKAVDMTIYTLRNMVERCFNKLKNSRRLATRYDKTAESFLGFVDVACISLLLMLLRNYLRQRQIFVIIARPCSVAHSFAFSIRQSASRACQLDESGRSAGSDGVFAEAESWRMQVQRKRTGLTGLSAGVLHIPRASPRRPSVSSALLAPPYSWIISGWICFRISTA